MWSKEYIHGPGGRVIATEERVTFADVIDGSLFSDTSTESAREV